MSLTVERRWQNDIVNNRAQICGRQSEHCCDDIKIRGTMEHAMIGLSNGRTCPCGRVGTARLHRWKAAGRRGAASWMPECRGYRPSSGPEALSGVIAPPAAITDINICLCNVVAARMWWQRSDWHRVIIVESLPACLQPCIKPRCRLNPLRVSSLPETNQ